MISLTQTDMAIPSEPYSAMQSAMAGASSGRHSRQSSFSGIVNRFNKRNVKNIVLHITFTMSRLG